MTAGQIVLALMLGYRVALRDGWITDAYVEGGSDGAIWLKDEDGDSWLYDMTEIVEDSRRVDRERV